MLIKGKCHEMIFFESLNMLICTFCECADSFKVFQKLFTTLYKYSLFICFFEITLKMLTETLLRIPFSVIGRCSLVPASHWLQGKCARINLSQAAFGMILKNNRRFPATIFSVKIATLGPLKRVSRRISARK